MRVILRADDIGAFSEAAQLERVYGPVWECGQPVCLSVIPRSAYRFGAHGAEPAPPTDLREAPALCDFLSRLARAGLVDIALHGLEHHYGELASGTQAQIAERLSAGLALLREALPGVPVHVLVPPHDALSPAGVRAARQLGLRLCSTWAACHGGTRLAHLWSRIRRRAGLSAATLRGGCWVTDCAALDFADRAAVRGPTGRHSETSDAEMDAAAASLLTTRKLMARFGASQAPIALPQHYWRLLDETGAPNARHASWRRWLDEFVTAAPAAVEFVRYGD